MSSETVIQEGQVLAGPLFAEPMRIETVRPNDPDAWVASLVGLRSEQFRRVTLTSSDISNLTIADTALSHDADERLLRLGLQAYALGIAYEFDLYFGLSISRVDPLPHQHEVVYEHLLKLLTVSALGSAGISRCRALAPIGVGNDCSVRTSSGPSSLTSVAAADVVDLNAFRGK